MNIYMYTILIHAHMCVYIYTPIYIRVHFYVHTLCAYKCSGFSSGSAGGTVFPPPSQDQPPQSAAPRDSGLRTAASVDSFAEAGSTLVVPTPPVSAHSMPTMDLPTLPSHYPTAVATATMVPPSTVPVQEASMQQTAADPGLLSQPLLAEAGAPDPARRTLHAAFDEVAFKQDLNRQLELDAYQEMMDEQLAEKKRAFEAEAAQLEEQAKARKLAHDQFMRDTERDYSERCRRHKMEMLRLHDEEKQVMAAAQVSLSELKKAKMEATAELEQLKREITKQKMQD